MTLGGKTRSEVAMKQFDSDLAACLESRRKAYALETDGIYFDVVRGIRTMNDWEQAVDSIKARYPKPVSTPA